MIRYTSKHTIKISTAGIVVAFTILLACKKEEKPVSNEIYSFTGNIDNSAIRWEVKASGNAADTSKYHARAHYYYGQWPIDCATSDCYDVKAGTVVNERNRGNGIEVVFLQATKSFDINQLQPQFTPGFKAYGNQRTSPYTTTQNGVLVVYTENGRVWRSEIGDQTGSTFELLEFKEATTEKNIYSHVWRARFTCKVYFSGLPQRALQNCEIYGPAFNK
jgi:hypothetical protein